MTSAIGEVLESRLDQADDDRTAKEPEDHLVGKELVLGHGCDAELVERVLGHLPESAFVEALTRF